MEKAELLSTFNEKLESFERFRGFIEKAEAATEKFSPEVIAKVVSDNEAKAGAAAEAIRPLVADMEAVVADQQAQIAEIQASSEGATAAVEELTLRNMIGELSDDDFAAKSEELKAELGNAEERIAEIQTDLEQYETAVGRWRELGGAPEPEPVDEIIVADARGDGNIHSHTGGMVEDMSAVFGDAESGPAAIQMTPDADGAEIAIETAEVDDDAESEDDDGSVDVDFGVEDDGEELDILSEAGGEEVEIDLLGDEGDGDGDGDAAGHRRALLLYQEGTAEEQIYPFTSDVITIGRGRDNDIQIKNDSKVSRYHCKIFRRGDNFYIEDNKSSNGSLVNGELVTERRLFGGEEVVIGETFFRFRIME